MNFRTIQTAAIKLFRRSTNERIEERSSDTLHYYVYTLLQINTDMAK